MKKDIIIKKDINIYIDCRTLLNLKKGQTYTVKSEQEYSILEEFDVVDLGAPKKQAKKKSLSPVKENKMINPVDLDKSDDVE